MRLTKHQLDFYEENGYLTFDNYFRQAEVDMLLAEVPKLFAEDSPRRILERSGAVRTVFASHTTSEIYRRFSRLERLVGLAEELLRSRVYIHQFKINAKVALEGDLWEWHQDFLYWHKEDGMPAPRVLTAAVFLQEVNEFNGPMLLVPGSHRAGLVDVAPAYPRAHENGGPGRARRAGDPPWMSTLTADLKYKINKCILTELVAGHDIVSIKGAPGMLLIFHGSLFHASATNLSASDRISVFVSYNSVENRLRPVERPRPAFIANPDFSPLTPVGDDALLELGQRADA
jgi:ectoine hydroxylase